MKHAVEIWRDEMIDEATHKAKLEKAFEIAKKLSNRHISSSINFIGTFDLAPVVRSKNCKIIRSPTFTSSYF